MCRGQRILVDGRLSAEIVNGVQVVAAGEPMLAPRARRELIGHYIWQHNDPHQQHARNVLAQLSEREREIVTGVAQGKSNAVIAEEFFLAEATVKTHLYRAFAKAEVTNRVQLAIFAYKAGLVSQGAAGNTDSRSHPVRPAAVTGTL